MKLKTFRGGIHPAEKKGLTSGKSVVTPPIPKRVIIHLSQHIGAPARPSIQLGDEVLKGQKIGEAGGFVSAPVHASISGKVTAIFKFLHPNGQLSDAVQVEGNGDESWHESVRHRDDYIELSPKELMEIIRGAGIVGLGGAAFPTHIKLSPPKDKTIDTLILNGAECEPYLTADHRLMLENPQDVLCGLKILMKILNVKEGYIAIENNKPDAIKLMKGLTRDIEGVRVVPLKVKYPQGAEKQLIKAILNREVPPPPGLPMDVGVVVQNVGTAAAVAQAVRDGKPLIERIITLTGEGVREPKNMRVRIGTLVGELIDFCGGIKNGGGKLILGGPMMGISQASVDVPVVKGTSGITILPEDMVREGGPDPCLRCGLCIRVCPMNLMPVEISNLSENERFEEAERYNVDACIECGSCGYTCPSKRRLVHLFKYAKAEINARRRREAAK